MNTERKNPNRLAEYILYLILKESDSSFLLGDYEEEFNYLINKKGNLYAKIWYWFLIFESAPGFLFDSIYWRFVMLGNYIKTGIRNIKKNKLSSFINIFGMSAAISCSIIFFLMLDIQYTSDNFHKNAEHIFLTGYFLSGDEKNQKWGDSPMALGPALEADFPQIERTVRVTDLRGVFQYEDKVLTETIRFADPDFLDMFTFPLKTGNKDELYNKNTVILSNETTDKYFGKSNPINKQITLTFNNNQKETFIVKGVADKFPQNSSFGFDVLVSFEKFRDLQANSYNNWAGFISATFIQVKNSEEITNISDRMEKYILRHNAENIDRPINSFFFEPLKTLSWNSQKIRKSIASGSTPEALILLFIIGLFLLLQACFNYINISLAAAAKRLKEIGIRKVAGSRKSQLVNQFLGENLLLCLFALITGIIFTEFIFLPGLSEITGSREDISLIHFFGNIHLWMFFVVLLFLTGICAGFYPAFYISKLHPVNIFRKKAKFTGKRRVTSVLLIFQFGIAFLIICLVLAFWQNNIYLSKQDWGYDQENVFCVRLKNGDQFSILKNAAAKIPEVTQTAGSLNHIGKSEQRIVVEIDAKKHEAVQIATGYNYLETMIIRLSEGRFFNPKFSNDIEGSIMVNEQFVREAGWQNALNKTVRFDNRRYHVIGVIEDFHYEYFFEEINPVLFRLVPENEFRYFISRINSDSREKIKGNFKNIWHDLFPDTPFNSFYQNTVFDSGVRNNEIITKIFASVACITMVISCMGLFGLASLIISQRTKELSIHKVHGASIIRIAGLAAKKFIIILTLSIVLAAPSGYFFLKNLMDGIYRYHMPIEAFPFIAGAVVVFFTALLTISSQIYKSAVQKPIDALRYE